MGCNWAFKGLRLFLRVKAIYLFLFIWHKYFKCMVDEDKVTFFVMENSVNLTDEYLICQHKILSKPYSCYCCVNCLIYICVFVSSCF